MSMNMDFYYLINTMQIPILIIVGVAFICLILAWVLEKVYRGKEE